MSEQQPEDAQDKPDEKLDEGEPGDIGDAQLPADIAAPTADEDVFSIAPSVLIAEGAATRTTVVEVNARDRPGLLARLARVIHGAGHVLHSAHIATYGERAVDVFYLTNASGRKLDAAEIEHLRAALLDAVSA